MRSIDPAKLRPLREITHELPPCTRGRPIHVSTLYRWAMKGKNGVRLHTVCIGRVRCTTLDALAEFFAESSGEPTSKGAAVPRGPSTTRRRELTEEQLAAEGLGDARS